jgi:hypothetical protein
MEPTSGRWVCQRCYESNEVDASSCARCGLERGADPSQAQAAPVEGADANAAPQWTPPQADRRPAWLSFVLRFAWVGVIIVIAVVGLVLNARRDDNGQIANGGNLDVSELRVGDCFNLKDEAADTVSEVDARPCTEAHTYEMFHVVDMPEGDFPNDDAITGFIVQECVPAFGAFVGVSYHESALDFVPFTPTSESWDHGDRSIQCAALDPNDKRLTSTLRNAAR